MTDNPPPESSGGTRLGRRRGQRSPATPPGDRTHVADDALATLIGLAAHEVPGVVGMAPTNLGEGIRRILGVSQADEGVEIRRPDEDPERPDVELHVVVAYGVNIPVVAESVEERVRYAARHYGGVEVRHVKVHVAGVSRD
jgi:uncharacterized alkaline shock family protein YloU